MTRYNVKLRKVWNVAPPAPVDYVKSLAQQGIEPILAQIFFHRGYHAPDQVLAFLSHYEKDDNPFRLKGMTEAVYRLRMAIRHNEPIAVYGDFDADGVTATVLLTEVLERLGADVRPYIPDRVDEGYGLNSPALKHLADEGVRVVITVDCGIRSIREVEDGISYGLDVIISDHHSIGPVMPPALALLNPKQPGCPYPEKMLSGVGIVYKLIQALYMEATRRGYKKGSGWRPEEWLDLVAIGTVADVTPLRDENRALVKSGLKLLNRPERPGLQALYGASGIKPGTVNATTLGFMIGPRINAAGRLRSAMLAYNLLTAPDTRIAGPLAQQLNDINRERQQKTLAMQDWAEESIPGDPSEYALLFASDPRFEQGIVGLVASRLTEQYYRPSVVVQMGEHESHGSCRSIPEFHITHALEQCDDLLERYGGHAAAAGFTVLNEHIAPLRERLLSIADQGLDPEMLTPELNIDAELSLEQVTLELADTLACLEPTGEGNPPPLFITHDVAIAERQVVGADGNHLKLVLTNGDTPVDAIAFRQGELYNVLPDRVDVVYHLEADVWNGQRRIQIHVQDMHPAGT